MPAPPDVLAHPAPAAARGFSLGVLAAAVVTAVAVYATQSHAHHVTQASTVAVLAVGLSLAFAALTHVPHPRRVAVAEVAVAEVAGPATDAQAGEAPAPAAQRAATEERVTEERVTEGRVIEERVARRARKAQRLREINQEYDRY